MQWLLGIEQLIADGFTDGVEDSLREEQDQDAARTYYSFHDGSTAGEGRWAQGKTLVDDQDIVFAQGAPLAEDDGSLPAPDPLLFGTYDGNQGNGQPGTGGGVYGGSEGLLHQAKDKLTGG